jgi:putative ABC transport system permease protein
VERELDEELRFHLEERMAQEIAAGRTPAEARYVALRAMDGVEQQKEQCRDARHMNLIDNVLRDVRYAIRTLARTPGFTIAALLALALGIGANSAIFSVVNSVLLRPLPFAEPERLVMIFTALPNLGIERGSGSMADVLDWRAKSRVFESVEAINISRLTLTGDGEAEQVTGMSVTAAGFETLRVRPLFGRTFAAGEDQPGRPLTVVLSERLWQRRYGSDPGVLGREILVNGQPHTVIGVMPGSVEFGPRDVEAWAILSLIPPTRRGPFRYRGIARLKPGATVAQAAAEMDAIARRVEQENRKDHVRLRYPIVPLHETITGNIRPLLLVLSGAALLVLLIAVSNVANLMLARATARRRETAIRLSIGASRRQLIRQFMTESMLLSLAGGAMGIGMAEGGVAALRWLGPRDMPRLSEISVDGGVLAFTMLASLACAVLFGLAPAFAASAADLNESLKQGGRGGESRKQGRVRGALVVAQVTLSVLLLIGAGLLIRSFHLLEQVAPGFHAPPERVLTMNVALTGARYSDLRTLAAYWDQLLERVRALPGVEAASVALTLPPDRLDYTDSYEIEGKPLPPGTQTQPVPVQFVSHDYFKTLGVPLLSGRSFETQDRAGSPSVTIIGEALARKHFQGEYAVGRRLRYGGRLFEIIGVVGDVKYEGLARGDNAAFYQLSAQAPLRRMWLAVRTQGDAQRLISPVRQEIRNLDAGVPVDRVSTMAETLDQSVSLPRFRSLLMAVFAAIALLLSAIGIYGVIAYSVAQRTQEIGVRMALGATRWRVLELIVGQGARLAVAGITAGLAGAYGLTRIMEKMLFGVSASDTVTFASVALLLGGVAVVASLIPALRAARIDPVTALREE